VSDRILKCGICGKEKPDFDVKTVMCWWYYGSSYLVGDFYCLFCHRKTPTTIISSKGTPETGNCSFVDLPNYSDNYYDKFFHSSIIGINRTDYGENKNYSDHIAKARQIRQKKKLINQTTISQKAKEDFILSDLLFQALFGESLENLDPERREGLKNTFRKLMSEIKAKEQESKKQEEN